jgi:hypothetical protein
MTAPENKSPRLTGLSVFCQHAPGQHTQLMPNPVRSRFPANLNESLYALHVIIYRQDNAQPLPVDATQEQAWQIGEVFVTRTEVQTISPSQFGLHLSSALY